MNGWSAAWAVMRNDLILFRTEAMATALNLVVPLNFLVLFILFALSGGRAPVTVRQADQGVYGPALVSALRGAHTFAVTPVRTATAGLAALARSDSVAAITVPRDFTSRLAAGSGVAVPVTINNLNVDFADDIHRGLPLAILDFYRQRFPGALPVRWREVDAYRHNTGFLAYLAVSVETVALLIGGLLVGGRGIAGEWDRGSVKALLLSPAPAWSIVAGKLAAGFTTGLGSALLILAAVAGLGIRPLSWGPVFLVVAVMLLAFVSIGIAVGSLLRSTRALIPITMGVGLPLFFVSGPFGPISWDTPAAAAIARVFPVAYANAILQQAFHGYWPLDVSPATAWSVLAAWSVAALVASAWAYRRSTRGRRSAAMQ